MANSLTTEHKLYLNSAKNYKKIDIQNALEQDQQDLQRMEGTRKSESESESESYRNQASLKLKMEH